MMEKHLSGRTNEGDRQLELGEVEEGGSWGGCGYSFMHVEAEQQRVNPEGEKMTFLRLQSRNIAENSTNFTNI